MSVVHLPKSIGFNQWICNQCSHQWDFASLEERAVVPDHLTGGRIEQFLEEFLATKAVIKGEAEKIWNGCANAYQAISIAANEEKPRVFSEHLDRWRDQLIVLQETLIIDRLLPLVARYKVSSNEQMWLFQACHEAWSPVTAGYVDWFTFTIRGQLYGAGPWVIPEWAWQLRGAPRPIAHLDVSPDDKAAALLHCLEGTLERDLVVYRKGAIAKAFLARKPGEPPSCARLVAENLQPPEESREDENRSSVKTVRFGAPNSIDLKIWSQLDPQNNSLTRLKIKTARKDYRRELKTETNKILCDNRGNLNSMVIPSALFRMQLKKADEFAERQYSIFRDVWLQLGGVESPAFIRTISWKVIQPAFGAQGISVAHGQQMRHRRTGGLLPAQSQEAVCRAFDQLKSDWREKLETKALEWVAQSQGRALTAALHNSEGSAIPQRDKAQILAILGVTAPAASPASITATPKARSGRPPRLDSDFVDFAGGLWLNAKRRNLGSRSDSKALSKVTHEELAVIASSLDSKNYTPPAQYLEKRTADEVRNYNSRHSNSKTGAIKTWSQLVFVADKNHLRGMRRLLSRCAKKQASV